MGVVKTVPLWGVSLTPSQHTGVSLYPSLRSEGVEEGPSGLASPLTGSLLM